MMNKKLLIFLCNITVACLASETNLSIGWSSEANGKNQEDAFSYNSIKGREFYGVYDGHAGNVASTYLKDNLATQFAQQLLIAKTKKDAFECTFNSVECDVLKKTKSGSTAVAVYVGKKTMHIAWVGDSRALVVADNGTIGFVTQDHDLNNKNEWDRVCKAEGVIFREVTKTGIKGKWRINSLEMTRSVGDRICKGKDSSNPAVYWPQPHKHIQGIPIYTEQWPDIMAANGWELKPLEGQVIAEPEYAQVPLTETHRWLILATDGLWNFVSNEQAGSVVKEKAGENNSVGSLAKILVKIALDRGSKDNITVLVVDLWSRKGK